MALTDVYYLEPVQKPYVTKKIATGVRGGEQVICYFTDISEHNLVLRKSLAVPIRPVSRTATPVEVNRRPSHGVHAVRLAESALTLLAGVSFFVVLVAVYFFSSAVSIGNSSLILAGGTATVVFSIIFLISLRFLFWVARRAV